METQKTMMTDEEYQELFKDYKPPSRFPSPEYASRSPEYTPFKNDNKPTFTFEPPKEADLSKMKVNITLDDSEAAAPPSPEYVPDSPEYHPDGTFGPEPEGERTRGWEVDNESGKTKIIKLDPVPMNDAGIFGDDFDLDLDDREAFSDMELEDANLDMDDIKEI